MIDTIMHWLGFGLCHQLPERSFFAMGHQFPVCARDTGMYLGFIVSFALIVLLDRGRRRSGLPPRHLMVVGLLLFASMVFDGVTSYAGLRETTNTIRFLTGFGAGYALPLVVVPLLASQFWAVRPGGRLLGSTIESLAWVFTMPVAAASIHWGAPYLGMAYLLLSAAAVVATFVSVNLIAVLLIPRFERRSVRLAQAFPAVLIAAVLTGVELVVADQLRLVLLSIASRV